jgi:hypothetical protein
LKFWLYSTLDLGKKAQGTFSCTRIGALLRYDHIVKNAVSQNSLLEDTDFAPQRREERKEKARFMRFCRDQAVISNFFGFLCVLRVFCGAKFEYFIESFAVLQKRHPDLIQGESYYAVDSMDCNRTR